MACRVAVMLVLIVPLVLAAVSVSVSVAGVPAFGVGLGPITLLTSSELTVQENAQVPTSCRRTSASPAVAGFEVGDEVTINCVQGVLVSIASGFGGGSLGPVISIAGLQEVSGGVPAPGPNPTARQCAAAWNGTAPLASRDAIGAQSALGAYVGSESISLDDTTTGPACSIYFVLPGVRTSWVTSVWKDGTTPEWRGFTQNGHTGPTRGILSRAIIKAIATASTPGTSLGTGIQPNHWFWVSQHGVLSRAN
jgi:hypothetical protein